MSKDSRLVAVEFVGDLHVCIYTYIYVYIYKEIYLCTSKSQAPASRPVCLQRAVRRAPLCTGGISSTKMPACVYTYIYTYMYTSEFLFVREEIPPQGSEHSSRCRAPGADVQLGGTKSGLPGSMRAKMIRERQPQPVCVCVYKYIYIYTRTPVSMRRLFLSDDYIYVYIYSCVYVHI